MTHHGNEDEHTTGDPAQEHAHPDSGDLLGAQPDDVTAREQMGADVHTAIANGMRPVTGAEQGDLRGDPDAGSEVEQPRDLGIEGNEKLRTGDASMNADRG